MKKILTILLIYAILSAFPFTGCDNTAQENSNNENPHITVEERTISQEVTNTETTVVPEATSNNDTQSTQQTSDSNTTTEDAIPEEEIELGKTYFNETFQFEIKYPGIWSLIEEDIVPEVRLHGAYLFISNSNVTEIDNENIIDVDHIHAYGITSPVDMPEAGMTIGELITDDGTKVKTYFINNDGRIRCHYVFEATNGLSYWVVQVSAQESVYNTYVDVITDMVKSFRLLNKNPPEKPVVQNNHMPEAADTEGSIEILLNSNELYYVPELLGFEYYHPGVEYFVQGEYKDSLASGRLVWLSNNTNVAEVMDNGAIIPKSEGTAVITADYNGAKDDIEVTVKKASIKEIAIYPQDITLSYALYNEITKNNYELCAMVESSYGSKYDVTQDEDTEWISEDSSIVTVNKGFLHVHNIGETKITARFHGYETSINVNIKDSKIDSNKITLSKEEFLIESIIGIVDIRVKAEPDDGSIVDITRFCKYVSEDPSVAVVYYGEINACSEGETVVNIYFQDCHKSFKVKVINLDNKIQAQHSIP